MYGVMVNSSFQQWNGENSVAIFFFLLYNLTLFDQNFGHCVVVFFIPSLFNNTVTLRFVQTTSNKAMNHNTHAVVLFYCRNGEFTASPYKNSAPALHQWCPFPSRIHVENQPCHQGFFEKIFPRFFQVFCRNSFKKSMVSLRFFPELLLEIHLRISSKILLGRF